MPATVDRDHLTGLIRREEATFEERHPNSRELHERARHSLLDGVPIDWMTGWPGGSRCSSTPRAPGSPTSTATSTSISASATPAR